MKTKSYRNRERRPISPIPSTNAEKEIRKSIGIVLQSVVKSVFTIIGANMQEYFVSVLI